jgi:hypothetical protein
MAHPVNSIEYILTQWPQLERRFPYYAFFLFTEADQEFAQFFQNHFEDLDHWSGDGCMFFAIAPPPPDWSQHAIGRDYWRYFLANSATQVGYDTDAVKQAARYFNVPDEHLPALVIFKDIHFADTITIRLGGLNVEQMPDFFRNLFLTFNLMGRRQDVYLWRLRELIDALPHDRWVTTEQFAPIAQAYTGPRRPGPNDRLEFARLGFAPHQIAYRTEFPQPIESILRSFQQELTRLSDEVRQLREEQREGFRQVNVNLERLQVVLEETLGRIQEFRRPFINRWVEVDDQEAPPEIIREQKEQLHAEFDEFLERESHYLAERLLQTTHALPDSMQYTSNLLEDESRIELMTSEALWQNLASLNTHLPIDYSVCGIGLWKALEVEVNRTFVDALRVWHHICQPGIFSIRQQVQTSGELAEYGLFGTSRGRVPINRCIAGNLSGVELGKVGGLLANSAQNGLARVLDGLYFPTANQSVSRDEFLGNLAVTVSRVAKVYRNSYAHIRPMEHQVCNEFRDFLLTDIQPFSPLFTTLRCKETLLQACLI